jgi:hypothetical protein
MGEISVNVCVRNKQLEDEVSFITLDKTKILNFISLLTSSEFIVVELIMPNQVFIDLNIFYNKATDSINARFQYDLFHLSPKYFGTDPVLLSIIEESGDKIFYDELCIKESMFMKIFECTDIFIREGFGVESTLNKSNTTILKIEYFFDSDHGILILDFKIEKSDKKITIKNLHEKALKSSIVINEIIKKITNSSC